MCDPRQRAGWRLRPSTSAKLVHDLIDIYIYERVRERERERVCVCVRARVCAMLPVSSRLEFQASQLTTDRAKTMADVQ